MDRLILRQIDILDQIEKGIEPVLYWDAESEQFTLEMVVYFHTLGEESPIQKYLDTHERSVVIKSTGTTHNSDNTIFENISDQKVRQLFAEQIGLNMKELYQYILGPGDLEKANAIKLQNYINPSIETTLEEDGYETNILYGVEINKLPRHIPELIPEIYEDGKKSTTFEERKVSLVYAVKGDKIKLYVQHRDTHKGYTPNQIASAENATNVYHKIYKETILDTLSQISDKLTKMESLK